MALRGIKVSARPMVQIEGQCELQGCLGEILNLEE